MENFETILGYIEESIRNNDTPTTQLLIESILNVPEYATEWAKMLSYTTSMEIVKNLLRRRYTSLITPKDKPITTQYWGKHIRFGCGQSELEQYLYPKCTHASMWNINKVSVHKNNFPNLQILVLFNCEHLTICNMQRIMIFDYSQKLALDNIEVVNGGDDSYQLFYPKESGCYQFPLELENNEAIQEWIKHYELTKLSPNPKQFFIQ